MAIIIGIDPGSRITGFGVIKACGNKHEYLTCGHLQVKDDDFAMRLQKIYTGINEILTEYNPDEAAIEQVFMHANVNSALKLGQARGAAIVALANQGLNVAEYSARQIKQAVVGFGGADKKQIQHMVKSLLNLSKAPQADAADALAIAMCHANTSRGLAKLRGKSL